MSSLKITTVQTALHWEDREANLAMLEKKISAVPDRMEIVVLPEMFSTGFTMQPERLAEPMDGPTVRWMKKMAAAKRIILTGSVVIEEGGNYFNRLLWVLPNGQLGYYDKRHRFAFAGEDKHYSHGHRRLIASVNGWKINLQVCYDLRFPVWARQQMYPSEANQPDRLVQPEPEYDILINVANWPERRSHAWKTLLTARAIENQCFVVGVNRVGKDGNDIYHSGDSMVIDPMGETLYHKSHDEELNTITLQKSVLNDIRTKLPFLKDGDHFSIHNADEHE